MADVLITLHGSAGTVLATTVTGSEGMYNFINLQAGTYYVIQTNLATYDDVKDIDGGNPNNITVGLIGGEDKMGNDFVDERLGTISGSVNEENGKAISSVQITLKNANDIAVATTETDAAGDYIFIEVAPGNYTVMEENDPLFPIDVSDYDTEVDSDEFDGNSRQCCQGDVETGRD